MKYFAWFFAIMFVIATVFGIFRYVDYTINIEGYLKRAADANTVELAAENLQFALTEIEARGLTEGTTRVLWHTPTRDVGFWYTNLSASLAELSGVTEASTPLEKSNMLIKPRETLLDQGETKEEITAPAGISMFAVYFSGDGQVEQAGESLSRVLKPGGLLVSVSGVVPPELRRELFAEHYEWIRDGSDDLQAGCFVFSKQAS